MFFSSKDPSSVDSIECLEFAGKQIKAMIAPGLFMSAALTALCTGHKKVSAVFALAAAYTLLATFPYSEECYLFSSATRPRHPG